LTHHREHAHGHGHDDHGHGHAKPRDLRVEADPVDPQDMRNMGGLAALMPKTRWTYFIACLAIAGFPVAAGFYSKDEILWKAFSNGSTVIPGSVIWLIGLVAATCTSFYMFRSYYMTFYYRAPSAEHKEHVHESPNNITYVLITLAVACLIIGPLLGWPALFGGEHNPFSLEKWLEPVTQFAGLSLVGERAWRENHGLEIAFMLLSIGVATFGWWAARSLYMDAAKAEARLNAWKAQYAAIHALVYEKYRVDEIYQATFVRGFSLLASASAWFDRTVVDGAVNLAGKISLGIAWIDGAIDKYIVDGAVNLVAGGIIQGGREMRKVQTGRINNYVFAVTAGVVVIVLVAYLAA
jgi:NADH-quinone oxidoreductase subunit L